MLQEVDGGNRPGDDNLRHIRVLAFLVLNCLAKVR